MKHYWTCIQWARWSPRQWMDLQKEHELYFHNYTATATCVTCRRECIFNGISKSNYSLRSFLALDFLALDYLHLIFFSDMRLWYKGAEWGQREMVQKIPSVIPKFCNLVLLKETSLFNRQREKNEFEVDQKFWDREDGCSLCLLLLVLWGFLTSFCLKCEFTTYQHVGANTNIKI